MRGARSPPAKACRLNVAILGLGLIGGSIGLALRAGEGPSPTGVGESPADPGGSPVCVVGFDPDEQTLKAALQAGAIDEAAAGASQALAKADVVFVAAPVGALAQSVRLALRDAPRDCVITDVGSTKRALLAELASERGIERFIGGHPLAGAAEGGIAHARADLFEGAAWCLVGPCDEACRDRLAALIEGFGAHVVEIDASAHDRLMAHISHLPHVLANVLVAGLIGRPEHERRLAAAGPSFCDATRVAGASTTIWADIYLSNADMLIDAIDEAIDSLGQVKRILGARDEQALRAWNERARVARRDLLA